MHKKAPLKYLINFLTIFIPLLALFCLLLLYVFFKEVRTDRKILEARLTNQVNIKLVTIIDEFRSISSDLMMIADLHEMRKLVERDQSNNHNLEVDLLSFSNRTRMYDQVRYLNETGEEVVRINFNNGHPEVSPADQLQNKANRYYFKDAFELNKNEIFVSPLDLNIEHGQIEQPLKPMIRFGTPLFAGGGEKRGVLLLNYFGSILIEKIQGVSNIEAEQFSILNQDGYWLKGPDIDDEWGFMYEDKKNVIFSNKYPVAWKQISSSESGQFSNDNGLFTFNTFSPLEEYQKSSTGSDRAFSASTGKIDREGYFFKIVIHTPQEFLQEQTERVFYELFKIFILIILVLFAGSWAFAHFRQIQRKALLEKEKLEIQLLQAQKFEAIGTMAGGIAHNFNNLLAAILGYVDLACEDIPEENDAKGYLTKTIIAAERAKDLVEHIITFSHQKYSVNNSIQPSIILLEYLNFIKGDIAENITIEKTIKKSTSSIFLDPQQFKVVVNNLCINALDAMQDIGGTLAVTLEDVELTSNDLFGELDVKPGHFVKLSVSDTGHGILQKNFEKIFDPFFTTKEIGEGEGIGLSVVHGIVRKSSGKIKVESIEGKGSEFHVFLPVAEKAQNGNGV